MDGDGLDDGWGFVDREYDEYQKMIWEEEEEEERRRVRRRQVRRLRRAYAALDATPRVVVQPTKRRRIIGPTIDDEELSLDSLGLGPLSAAFSFLHPVELSRVCMTAKALRASVDAVWCSIFEERVRGCRRGYPSDGVFSAEECRRAVILEEGWLGFRSDLGELSHMAGCPPFRPPHQFRTGSLSDLLLKRYIFVRHQFEDSSKPLPSECECGEVNLAWCQLFPDRPLRCLRCIEFELALDCLDLAMVGIDSEIQDDRDESLWIALWEKKHCVG